MQTSVTEHFLLTRWRTPSLLWGVSPFSCRKTRPLLFLGGVQITQITRRCGLTFPNTTRNSLVYLVLQLDQVLEQHNNLRFTNFHIMIPCFICSGPFYPCLSTRQTFSKKQNKTKPTHYNSDREQLGGIRVKSRKRKQKHAMKNTKQTVGDMRPNSDSNYLLSIIANNLQRNKNRMCCKKWIHH